MSTTKFDISIITNKENILIYNSNVRRGISILLGSTSEHEEVGKGAVVDQKQNIGSLFLFRESGRITEIQVHAGRIMHHIFMK